MKVKANKKADAKAASLHKIKKSAKVDIAKPSKEKKSAPAAHSFAEKKVLAVKKKNKKEKIAKLVADTVQAPVKTQKVVPQKEPAKNKTKRAVENVLVADSSGPSGKKKKKQQKKENVKPDDKPAAKAGQEETELVKSKTIKAALKACKKALDAGFDKKKNLFGEDLKYGLQIAAVKIPDVPSRNCRVQLTHAIYQQSDDICLIVKDLARGSKQDHEETLHFWEDKLRELGIDYITQIIPFQQLKQDYRQYEMKLKLVHRFDRFLVDARINGHVYNFLGNGFIKRCKNPTPVILDKDEKIAKSLEKALSRVTYKQTNTGRVTEIQFATHKMPLEKSVENASALIEALKTQYPGGWQNIRTIYLKPMTDIQLTFPLYVSSLDPNSVPVPKIPGPREKFEKANTEKLLQTTGNKYKFQAGNLVRVPYEKREKKKTQKDKQPEKAAEAEQLAASKMEEDADSDDDDLLKNRERASDTEGSDLDDGDDD